jgi:hypothetical protein
MSHCCHVLAEVDMKFCGAKVKRDLQFPVFFLLTLTDYDFKLLLKILYKKFRVNILINC